MAQHRQGTLHDNSCIEEQVLTTTSPFVALKRMGKDFLSGYCHLVTGEKDPRNLRLAFTIERVMLVEFDISENVEVSIAKGLAG